MAVVLNDAVFNENLACQLDAINNIKMVLNATSVR